MTMIFQKLFIGFLLLASSSLQANCIRGNCVNGKGIKVSTSGDRWEGRFVNAKLNGEGEWKSKEGDLYHGQFRDGKMHGKGWLKLTSGDIYIGEFREGLFDGTGRYKYSNGDSYFGGWKKGVMNGRGTYTFKSGKVLDGEFVNGEPKQTLVKKDEDRIHVQEGATASVTKTDNLSLVTKDCTTGVCHEELGVFYYSDGSKFIGEFKNGNPDGIGRCEYINGDLYEGGFKNHSPHGKGIMHFASGQKYAAIWDYGSPKEQLFEDLDFIAPVRKTKKVFDEQVDIYALVVGVANYPHMPSLKYTDDDAYQMYAFLKSPEGGAVPEDKIKVLIDDNATKNNILMAMEQLFSRADANDAVFLYMSGHGLDGSFIPADFDGYGNNIPYTEITKIIDASEAKSKICIADACHSGSLVAAKTPYQASLDHYLNSLATTAGGTALMMSSAAEEVSLEYSGLRQGVFSHFLLKGMKGHADTDRNKIVTITELFRFISSGVDTYTANKQTPILTGSYDPTMPVAMVR